MDRRRSSWTISLMIGLILTACSHEQAGKPLGKWIQDTEAGARATKKGDYQTAVRYHSRAVQEAVQFGDNDPRLIQSLGNLGDAFEHERRLGEAQITYIAALKRQQKLFGPDSMSLVPTLDSINRVTCADGRCGSALPYLKQLLMIRKKHLGPIHRDTLATMQMLGETYEKEGKLDQALKCFQDKTAIAKTHFASDDLTVLNCSANVARVLCRRKEYGKAEKLLKHMLQIEEKYDWTNSPIVDSTMRNYKDVLRSTGRSAQAANIVYRPKKKTAFF